MSKNVYDMFRAVQKKRTTNYNERSAAFIVDGKLSKTIYHKRRRLNISAGIVYNNKEGPDEVIVYTFEKDNLQKGDYFILNNVNYLVYEEDKLVDEKINHRKQRAVECNVVFEIDRKTFQGYFISSLRRHNSEDFQRQLVLSPDENPLLILPSISNLTINTEFLIDKKPWRIVEYDSITNRGITYYYLERGIIKNEDENSAEIEIFEENTLQALVEHKFKTQNSLFSSNPPVDIVKKSNNWVTFVIPFGISEVTITTDEFEDKTFKVVV